jgi:hypothetical protein
MMAGKQEELIIVKLGGRLMGMHQGLFHASHLRLLHCTLEQQVRH